MYKLFLMFSFSLNLFILNKKSESEQALCLKLYQVQCL